MERGTHRKCYYSILVSPLRINAQPFTHACFLVNLQYEKRIVYGKAPNPRGYHATILADSRLFLFGGYDGITSYDDVHILDLAANAYLPQVTSFAIDAP